MAVAPEPDRLLQAKSTCIQNRVKSSLLLFHINLPEVLYTISLLQHDWRISLADLFQDLSAFKSVLPKPFSPLNVSSKESMTSNFIYGTGRKTIWVILSPGLKVKYPLSSFKSVDSLFVCICVFMATTPISPLYPESTTPAVITKPFAPSPLLDLIYPDQPFIPSVLYSIFFLENNHYR